jgi:hypothetical protein
MVARRMVEAKSLHGTRWFIVACYGTLFQDHRFCDRRSWPVGRQCRGTCPEGIETRVTRSRFEPGTARPLQLRESGINVGTGTRDGTACVAMERQLVLEHWAFVS